MARKSRKHLQTETSVSAEAPNEDKVATAIYARLSVENSGKDDEGDSIENQISFCRAYIDEHPYLRLVQVYEDNGRKGTNFKRPAFQKMMDDIKAGAVKCIVVKDLSR